MRSIFRDPVLEVNIAELLSPRSRPRAHPANERSLREPGTPPRITRIDESLVLVSVCLESELDAATLGVLSAAENAVVELTLRGLTNAAIARERQSSPRTVANQLSSAYRKLGVGNRRELRTRLSR